MGTPAYSRRAWCYIAGIALGGAAFEAFLLALDWPPSPPAGRLAGWPAAAVLCAAAVAAALRPVEIDRGQKLNVGTAAIFAAVLLASPATAGMISAAAIAVAATILRRPWYNVLFSVGQRALSAGGAGVVYRALWGPARPPFATGQAALAALAAGLVHLAVPVLIVGGVVALTQERPFGAAVRSLAVLAGVQDGALVGAGALVAVCAWSAPWAVPLPALALPLIGRLNRAVGERSAALARLEEALARQRRFVSDIAHEIGTPLTTLAGNLEVLRRGGAADPAEFRETLEDVAAEFSRLAGAFSDLLLLAEADERGQLDRRPVRLDLLLADLADVWTQLAAQRGLSLEVEPLAPITVDGDATRLRQLVSELVENATRYTPAGGRITLALRVEGDQACLVVADTGVGIEPEDLPRIFERFYRGRAAAAAGGRPTHGTGLGLAIARWIVEGHGGRIAVESTPGRGSRFQVFLPLVSPPEGEHGPRSRRG